MKKIDFFSREIERMASLPFDQAWSRASKKSRSGPLQSIASYDEKSAAQGAKKGRFCLGILVTLGLSTENAPRAGKIFLLIRWPQSTRRNLC